MFRKTSYNCRLNATQLRQVCNYMFASLGSHMMPTLMSDDAVPVLSLAQWDPDLTTSSLTTKNYVLFRTCMLVLCCLPLALTFQC